MGIKRWLSIVFSLALLWIGRSGFAQVSTNLTVAKVQDFKQTGTAAPVQVTNPFTLTAIAQPQGYTIASGTVTLPTGGQRTLVNGGNGIFGFTSGFFATAAALNSVFPAGAYGFSVQPTSGAAITGTVTMPLQDNYPPAPTLSNREWTAGALQFNPTQNFVISWQAGAAPSDIRLTVNDPSGTIVFATTVSNTSTTQAIPANTLLAGTVYTGRLTFGRTTVTPAGAVTLRAAYQSVTNFSLNPVGNTPGLFTPSGFTAVAGQPLVYQVIANTLATYDVASLPAGLTFDPITGLISGTPTTSGSPSPNYTLQNTAGVTPGIINLNIQAPPAGPSFANATSATGHIGVPFTFQVVTTGASPSATITATNLPGGLTINSATGRIAGTVTGATSNAVTLTVHDGSFTRTSSLELTFVKDPIIPIITSAKTVTLYPGQPFSYQVAADYGTNRADEPTFKVVGTLPTGLSFDAKTGIISGVFGGQLETNGGPPEPKFLNDSPLVQLAGTNTHGTGTSPLIFLAAPAGTVNLSTRMFVGTGDEVLIGGFIVTGTAPENLVMRAIGPSLPLGNALQDTLLELHDNTGAVVTSNDDWRSTQEQAIKDTGVPPGNDHESAIVATFQPSHFTAIVGGKNSTTGIGLVEIFDLGTVTQDTSQHAKLAQISTRGTVHTGDDVMIGGFIIQGPATKTLLRAIGPELAAQGVSGALQDTFLELHTADGAVLSSNDNWVDSPDKQAIIDTTIPPTDDRESAIIATLSPGNYTAVLRGKNDTTGVALVEVYNLQ